jgi:hypothetical protein
MGPRRTITQVSAWVDRDFASRFAALARENERSASAEARLALRRHLEKAERDVCERDKAAA